MLIYIDVICPMCGCWDEIAVYEDDYLGWKNGKLAQDAFPYLNADERERLISGICPDCWGEMFGEEDY